MWLKRLLLPLCLCGIVFFPGCGGGSGKDLNGSLTVTHTQTDSDTYSQVSFTVTYADPYKTDVLGTEIALSTASSIGGYNGNFIQSTNNSGSFTLTYLLPRDTSTDQYFSIRATTGDLVASDIVIVKKQGQITAPTLTATPSSVTFSAGALVGDTQTVVLSGGSGTYSVLSVNPGPTNPNIGATVAGKILTITKKTTATGASATVLVSDTSTPQGTVSVTVNY